MADYVQSAVPKSLIARIGRRMAGVPDNAINYVYQPQSVNITLNPIVQTGWFGPGQPLAPQADTSVAGRIFDFPVTTNIDYQPKSGEGVPYQTLYNLARYYDCLRIVIEACKDDIAKQDFNIVPRDPTKKPDDRCAKIQAFLEYPDQQHSWDQWIRMLIDQMLVYDAMTIYPRMTNGGELYALEVMDGSTIKRVIDYWGRTPLAPEPAYQQILKGVPAIDYTKDELIFFPTNVTPERIYGYSIVEQIITTINISLRRQAYFLQYYTEGSTPDLIISVPKDWTSKQIAEWQAYWSALLQGNTSSRRGTTFVPDGFTVNNTKDQILTDKSDEWLIRIICFSFGVSPQPFLTMMNRATAETSKEQSEERGSGNRLQRLRALMRVILTKNFNAPDLDFKWKEEDEVDPKTKTDNCKARVMVGAMTLDEWRRIDGEDPLPNGMGAEPIVFTASGGILLQDVIDPPDPPPVVMAPGNPNAPGAKPKDGTTPTQASKRAPIPHASGAPHPVRTIDLAKSTAAALALVGESASSAARSPRAHKATGDGSDGVLTEDDLSAFMAYVLEQTDFDALGILASDVESSLAMQAANSAERAMLRTGITDPDLFSLGSENAQKWAKSRAAELISDNGAEGEISDATRNMIRTSIEKAFAEGQTREALADALARDYAFGDTRASLIAETELRTAESNGYLEGAKATGLDLQKQWIPDDDPCEDCQANVDAGLIALSDAFPSGDDAPQAHPNCKCALGIVTADGNESEE